jgi:hypothetical protein
MHSSFIVHTVYGTFLVQHSRCMVQVVYGTRRVQVWQVNEQVV